MAGKKLCPFLKAVCIEETCALWTTHNFRKEGERTCEPASDCSLNWIGLATVIGASIPIAGEGFDSFNAFRDFANFGPPKK